MVGARVSKSSVMVGVRVSKSSVMVFDLVTFFLDFVTFLFDLVTDLVTFPLDLVTFFSPNHDDKFLRLVIIRKRDIDIFVKLQAS
ncbi:hypothetical protein [Segatella copri]|uniref:hypothetical protein n=1 Tax=Segatella copri TaxID=165179 RepID=UPI001C44DEE5|nr:hypothetical protein [Segatella copri]MBW0044791.1 hypothetical protein [Segatella copri]